MDNFHVVNPSSFSGKANVGVCSSSRAPRGAQALVVHQDEFTEKDVLSGRGGLANTHSGNRVFRRLVELNKEPYRKMPGKIQKSQLVDSILMAVRSQGGRFLKLNPKTKEWYEISHKESFVKTSQALRENPNTRQKKCSQQQRSPSLDASCNSRDGPSVISREDQEQIFDDDLSVDESIDSASTPVPPALHLSTSAVNPLTSKIAAAFEEEDSPADTFAWPAPLTMAWGESTFSTPESQFSDTFLRQDSLDLSTLLQMPDMSKQTSAAFVEATLVSL